MPARRNAIRNCREVEAGCPHPAGFRLRHAGPRGEGTPPSSTPRRIFAGALATLWLFAALAAPGAAPQHRATHARIAGSLLHLGGGAWTVEGWLWLDAEARNEGVIFECGTGPRGEGNLVTRFSLSPRENAFLFAGLAPVPVGPATLIARHVEFPNPEGPPSGAALLFHGSLVSAEPLPRERWFHAALVHTATGELHLFVDGRHRATVAADLLPLPRGDESYVSIGCDGRAERPFPGAIDELRVSDHAAYPRDGAAPGGFSPRQGQSPASAPAEVKPRPEVRTNQP